MQKYNLIYCEKEFEKKKKNNNMEFEWDNYFIGDEYIETGSNN